MDSGGRDRAWSGQAGGKAAGSEGSHYWSGAAELEVRAGMMVRELGA